MSVVDRIVPSVAPVAGDRRDLASLTLSVGAVLMGAGSVGYMAMNAEAPREGFVHPLGILTSAVTAVGCMIVGLALARWRAGPPRWAVLASAAGIWFAGAVAWGQATFVVAAGTGIDNEQFDDLFFQSPWVLGGMAPKSLLCLLGFLGLAVAGWRRRVLPRSAAAGFGLAAILSIWPPYPPGLVVASASLVVVALHGRSVDDG